MIRLQAATLLEVLVVSIEVVCRETVALPQDLSGCHLEIGWNYCIGSGVCSRTATSHSLTEGSSSYCRVALL